jgi:phage terminase large subunit-like protein
LSVASAAKKKPKARDYSAIAEKFEEDVLSGKFPAAPIFVAAIERQRREVAAPPEGFAFMADVGALACRRMERFPFAGDGPKRGTPFQLEPWQVWVVVVLFGWVDPTSGFRRWREASIWLPKGNGKSPLAALIVLCVLVMGKGGEQTYSAATTQDQARCVFDMARDMLNIDADSALRVGRTSIVAHFGLVVEEHRIKGLRDGRIYRPISAEHRSAEGIRPTLVVLDEVHVQANRKLYDNLKTACNKVDGSMILGISTAGFDMSPQSLGWQLYSRARDILERKLDSPATFALIVEADRTLDPLDFNTWKQANPNLGVSVSLAGLKSAMQTMATTPSERPSLEVKHLGWWQQTANAFLDVAKWNALGDPLLSLDDCDPDEWEIFVGVDLARTRDLSAAPVVAARTREDGKREYRVFTRRVYLPEASVTVKLIPELKGWSEAGWLVLLPGETMTFRPLTSDLVELLERFPNVTAAVDDWMAGEVEADLMAAGVTVVSIRQGAKTQSEPMKELEGAILDGRLTHDASPVAAMCIGNLQAQADRNGNLAPTRENEFKKIDVAVGIINALVLARGADAGAHQGDLLL